MQDRSSFENEWEKAFAEAKSAPPEKVWNKLELHLAESTSGMYKKRLTFFKMLAAASIFLAFSIGGIAVYLEYFHLHGGDRSIAMNEDGKSDSNQGSTGQLESVNDGKLTDAENFSSFTEKDEAPVNDELEAQSGRYLNQNESRITQDSVNDKLLPENGNAAKMTSGEDLLVASKRKDQDSNNNDRSKEGDDRSSNLVNEPAMAMSGESHDSSFMSGSNNIKIDMTKQKSDIAMTGEGDLKVNDKNKINDQADFVGETMTEVMAKSSKSGHPTQNKDHASNQDLVDELDQSGYSFPVAMEKDQEGIASVNSRQAVPDVLDGLYEPLFVRNEISEPTLTMVPWYANAFKKKIRYQRLWAGVGVSRGSFDPNGLGMEENDDAVSLVDAFDPSLERSIAPQRFSSPSISDETQGSSLNLGVNIGARLSRRWIVQSGLNYLEQNTSSSSNLVTVENASSDPLTEFGDQFSFNSNEVVFIDEYGISNSYKSISIPIQAGYILLDRKFNITLLGGVSNDFLVAKSVTDDTGVLETVVIEGEEVTNLNTYNISAIIGSEFGYNLGQYYSISINPQFRRSLSSFNQGNGSGESFPIGIEIGFRFKYLLK